MLNEFFAILFLCLYIVPLFTCIIFVLPYNCLFSLKEKGNTDGWETIFFLSMTPFLNLVILYGAIYQSTEPARNKFFFKKNPDLLTLQRLKNIRNFYNLHEMSTELELKNIENFRKNNKPASENDDLFLHKISKLYSLLEKNYSKPAYHLLLIRYGFVIQQIDTALKILSNEDEEYIIKFLNESSLILDDLHRELQIILIEEKEELNIQKELDFKKFQQTIQTEKEVQKKSIFSLCQIKNQ